MDLRVIVGCEYSATVRDAFAALGWDAWSCDLLPCEKGGKHYQGDIFEVLGQHWDLGIFHPPCTFLTVSGNTWFRDTAKAKPGIPTGQARRDAQKDAVLFVKRLWESLDNVAIENPIGRLSTLWRPPTQTIQPWHFGHGETKGTCLWLKNLPPLLHTRADNDLFLPAYPKEREQRVFKMAPGKDRAKERARFYPGIAQAMAEQWTEYLSK